jgi:8-oxo-dGTP pyrophosphatase MutT (NUDIX family)
MSPVVAGAAAVINSQGAILLMRRRDNGLWAMPAGQMEVGESPAEAVVRETYEETGVRCRPTALVGIYDARFWDNGPLQHVYKFTFLCEPLEGQQVDPFDPLETLETGWFDENALPETLYPGHRERIGDAYRVWQGDDSRAYFDWENR